jgi:hypothetical protein
MMVSDYRAALEEISKFLKSLPTLTPGNDFGPGGSTTARNIRSVDLLPSFQLFGQFPGLHLLLPAQQQLQQVSPAISGSENGIKPNGSRGGNAADDRSGIDSSPNDAGWGVVSAHIFEAAEQEALFRAAAFRGGDAALSNCTRAHAALVRSESYQRPRSDGYRILSGSGIDGRIGIRRFRWRA